jgi:hypothetical protein
MRPELVKGMNGVEFFWHTPKGFSKNVMSRDMFVVQQQRRKRQVAVNRLSTPNFRRINTIVDWTKTTRTARLPHFIFARTHTHRITKVTRCSSNAYTAL